MISGLRWDNGEYDFVKVMKLINTLTDNVSIKAFDIFVLNLQTKINPIFLTLSKFCFPKLLAIH